MRPVRCSPIQSERYSPAAIRHLIDTVGLSQVVVGTDDPCDMGQYDVHGLLEAVAGLGEAERANILSGNALWELLQR